MSIFFIGIALSMDAFSLALTIGSTNISKAKITLLVLSIGIMHFIMPLLGLLIGNNLISFININPDIILSLILIIIAVLMYHSKEETEELLLTTISILLMAISVSLDSLGVGIGIKALSNYIFIPPLIFSLCSSSITYMGITLGKYSARLWGSSAKIFGCMLLLIIGIVNICKYFLS